MGFKNDKKQVLDDLQNGNFDHDARTGRTEDTNYLAAGKLTPDEATEILKVTRGNQHQNLPHHQVNKPGVWVFKPDVGGVEWYIKGYFLAGQTWFISFHPSN